MLVPHNLETKLLIAHLSAVNPDFLVAEAGAVEVDAVVAACPSLRHIIWVAKEGNRHMDWNVVPEGTGGKVEVVVWHELVDERKTLTSTAVPAIDKESAVQPLSTFWPAAEGVGQLVEYTSEVSTQGKSGFGIRADVLQEPDLCHCCLDFCLTTHSVHQRRRPDPSNYLANVVLPSLSCLCGLVL